MFAIGDHVRLLRGWTLMTVIGFSRQGEVIAQYGPDPYPEDLKYPEQAFNTYTRYPSGFVHWDGQPVKETKMKTFQVNDGSGRTGKFLNYTSNGVAFVLEFSDGTVEAFNPRELTEITPVTFLAKAVGSTYPSAHFLVPDGIILNLNEMLLSSSGNVYIVSALNTKSQHPKGVFSGVRIVTEKL